MTGHTADDQAETMLVNLLRGAGSAGLAAMRPGPVHPILALRRSETEEVCTIAGLDPVCDPSNTDPRFVRNRIRHEVLPLLADVANRDPVPLLCRTAELTRSVSDDLQELASGLDPTDTRRLRGQPDALVRVALREWLRDGLGHPPSSAELERVLAVVHHRSTACELSGGRRVERTEGILRVVVPEAGFGRGLA